MEMIKKRRENKEQQSGSAINDLPSNKKSIRE